MAGKRQLLCAVSACLCGRCVRYDGGGFDIPALRRLAEEGMLCRFARNASAGFLSPVRLPSGSLTGGCWPAAGRT